MAYAYDRLPSWRTVAGELAARMEHHAFCDRHRLGSADPDNCPFCADREAWLLWRRKAGLDAPEAAP